MPLSATEIMLAKIWSNALVILAAATLSVFVIVRGVIDVPMAGSLPLFLLGLAAYLLSLTAIGILLATVARSMPQFGLLSIPVFVIGETLRYEFAVKRDVYQLTGYAPWSEGFVEQQQLRLNRERAGDGHALSLPAREGHAALADDRIIALLKAGDELVGLRLARAALDLGAVDVLSDAKGNVVGDRARKQKDVLLDGRDLGAHGSVIAQVHLNAAA